MIQYLRAIFIRKALFAVWINLWCIASVINAQNSYSKILDQYNFSGITINDGLPHNFIADIYKDNQGFLWLSTQNGLSRYDGYSFVNYNISSTIPLRSNFINQVCEDDFNRLWIASEAGLDLLDLNYNKLDSVDYSLFKSEDLSKEPVYFVTKDNDNSIWLATQRNLYCLTLDSTGHVNTCIALTSKYERHSAPITALRLINGNIWMAYGANIYQVEKEKELFSLKKIISDQLISAQTHIHCFYSYNEQIWIGTDMGLKCYIPQTNTIRSYSSTEGKLSSLSHNYITDIASTESNELVVATLRGLNFYTPETDDFLRLEYLNNSSERTISSNFINCLFADGAVMWIGTEISGLDKMESRRLKARIYTNNINDPGSLSDNPVNSIFEDSKNNLWVGNVEKGLSIRLSGSDKFIHYQHQENQRNSVSHNSISSIVQDNQDRLWIGTWGGGLNCTQTETLPQVNFTHYFADKSTFRSNYIGALCFDKLNSGLWIGTTGGLSFFDVRKHTFTNVPLLTDNLSNNSMAGMFIDSKQRLWIGMYHGLLIIDLYSFAKNRKDTRYHYLEYKLDQPESRLIEKINCIYEASDGNIWLGSNGHGIYKLINDSSQPFGFINLSTKNGLCDNTVLGIGEDKEGNMWFGTNNGLSCYTQQTNSFITYYKNEGLLFDQFYRNAYCKSKDGTLYWGGINGMFGLNSIRLSANNGSKKVVFTRFTVLDNDIEQGNNNYLNENISRAEKVHLHERDKSFTISFSALDFENTGSLKYFYRLNDFDNKWIECAPRQPHARYTNLKSGKYVFQVRTLNPLNMKDSEVSELTIIVKPFFYKTWWFGLLCLIIISAWVVYWYQLRVSIYKKQKRELTAKVKERTLELEDKMSVLSRQNDQLVHQKKQLLELSKRIQEITADKISFFTNITHEFRTPITLIMGPIGRAKGLNRNEEVRIQLEIAEKNSKSLLSLVNQLLDFRKVESERIMINKISNNLPEFIEDIITPFALFAKERQIEVRLLSRLRHSFYKYDEEWIRKVLVNLLSNAIKFTPNGGKVDFYVCGFQDKNKKENLYFSITDTGIGILEQDIDKVFEKFYQSRKHVKYPVYGQSGTGIGLYLCKKIVNEHGGRIYARNNHGTGTSVKIIMPVEICAEQAPEKKNLTVNLTSVIHEQKQELNKQQQETSKKTILVVEDNPDMRTYIKSILDAQYTVLEAENGEVALHLLKKQKTDFIVSDLMMPVMDGLELSKRIKEDLTISHIPLLILTAKVSNEVRIESFRIGVDEYLQKPFSEELLLVRIKNILKAHENARQQFAIQMNPGLLNLDEESRDNKFLKTVMQIIETNYQSPEFDVNTFATATGISKTLLNQKLQNLIGLPTARFIRSYRLNKAHSLILENKISRNLNVSQIAYEVGFNDPKYFSRCYQKKFGILPNASLEQ